MPTPASPFNPTSARNLVPVGSPNAAERDHAVQMPVLPVLPVSPGSRLAFEQRVHELVSANEALRRAVEGEARKLQLIMHGLALAAERLGDWPLARVIRSVAAQPSDLACVVACGQPGEPACALHGAHACEHCRALGPAPAGLALSKREREVLRLLAEGSRSPCIAEHLKISIATVEVHRRNIMRKLDLHTIAELTKYALRAGLTSL